MDPAYHGRSEIEFAVKIHRMMLRECISFAQVASSKAGYRVNDGWVGGCRGARRSEALHSTEFTNELRAGKSLFMLCKRLWDESRNFEPVPRMFLRQRSQNVLAPVLRGDGER